jgi:hypothetical protein
MSKTALIITAIIVYIASTGASYFFFSKQSSAALLSGNPSAAGNPAAGKTTNDYQALTFDGPKTEPCPLNGALYSKDQRAWWEGHRPLAVMIENSIDARPQSGINAADITYEVVAEGGITRTMNVFYCNDAGIVGPVRSARTYFLDFISEYTEYPLYAHVGGANTSGPANALGQIGDYGWNGYNDLSQFSIGFPTFWRDESRLGHDVATEHTMYSTTSKLWDVGKKRALTNVDKDGKKWDENFVPYTFKDDAPASARPESQTIHIEWTDPGYAVDWIYSKKDNVYLRKNGGEPHMDRNTHQQLQAHNVVVLFMKESHANDGYEGNQHMLYGTKGTGKASIFIDGKEINGTWKKADRQGRTLIYDASGKAVTFNRGKIWFTVQPTTNDITVK